MPASRPKARDDIDVVEYRGERVIFDGETGDVHYLNPTASLVFQLCDGSGTVAELSADIAEAFELPVDQVRTQVGDLVRAFREAGLLAGSLELIKPPPEPRGQMSGDHVPQHDHAGHVHDHDDHEDGHHAELEPGHEVDARDLIEEQEPAST